MVKVTEQINERNNMTPTQAKKIGLDVANGGERNRQLQESAAQLRKQLKQVGAESKQHLHKQLAAITELDLVQSQFPRDYAVHFPNTKGFSVFSCVSVVPIKPGDPITSGSVLVEQHWTKKKCNIKDNRTGLWVRMDYARLQDYWKGKAITYHADGTATEVWGAALRRLEQNEA
jgi:hypothetical protein